MELPELAVTRFKTHDSSLEKAQVLVKRAFPCRKHVEADSPSEERQRSSFTRCDRGANPQRPPTFASCSYTAASPCSSVRMRTAVSTDITKIFRHRFASVRGLS